MNKYTGIWLDHEKALMVTLTDDKVSLGKIKSGVEGRFRLSGGSRSTTLYGPQQVVKDRKLTERRKHQLHLYYRDIIKSIPSDMKKMLLMGPGAAKVELKKEIDKLRAVSGRLAGIKTTDKMSERQIVAAVKDFFIQ